MPRPFDSNLAVRVTLLALCLLTAFGTVHGYREWRATQEAMMDLVTEAGLAVDQNGAETTVMRRLRYEITPHHAKEIAARALLTDAMNDPVMSLGPPYPVIQSAKINRLPRVREIALEVLQAQPTSWQGLMLLGGSRYLEWSLLRDRRLVTEAASWEQPLIKATEVAPGYDEPKRVLATAYLETWLALSPEKRAKAKLLLAEVLANDQTGFHRLLPRWLEQARSLEETFSVMPPRSASWQTLLQRYADQHDWTGFIAARQRFEDALEHELTMQVENAAERIRLGDYSSGRTLLLSPLLQAPPSHRFAGLVTRAMETYTPGIHAARSSAPLLAWLRWAFDQHVIERNPFSSRVIHRILDAIGPIERFEEALAQTIAGDLYAAEEAAKITGNLGTSAWAPYLVAKSRLLLERQQFDEARTTLDLVGREERLALPFLVTQQRVASTSGNLNLLAETQRELDKRSSDEWNTLDLKWRNNIARLLLLPSRPADGLVISSAQVPEAGAVVKIFWNGDPVALEVIRPGQDLVLRFPIADDTVHLFEFAPIAGGEVIPKTIRLL